MWSEFVSLYFLKRNGAHGYHIQDWLKAEAEIKSELTQVEKTKKTVKKKQSSVKAADKKTKKKAAAKKTAKKK